MGPLFPYLLNPPMVQIYCASYAHSGVWAFSPEAIRAFAPVHMLERSEYSSGQVWSADLADLDGALWSFAPVC